MYETINTTAKIELKNLSTGDIVSTEHEEDVECCQYINNKSMCEEGYVQTLRIEINSNEMPTAHRSSDFVYKWIDFINTFGIDVQLEEVGSNFTAIVEYPIHEKNYYYLFNLNLVRYLWSTHYAHFPILVFQLRENETLSDLSNWEIFQLAHHVTGGDHFNDMTPIDTSTTSDYFHIVSQEFLTSRLFANKGSNLTTFNMKFKGKPFDYIDVYNLCEKEEYLAAFNLLSTRVNNISEKTHALCMDNKGFEDCLNKGNEYEMLREMGKVIRITDEKFNTQLYAKSRFKLV